MNVTVYAIQGVLSGTLTIDHANSSYAIPVLVINGKAYGPDDHLPGNPISGAQMAKEAVITRADSLIPDFDPMSTEDIDCTADNADEAEFQTLLTSWKASPTHV